MSRQVRRLSLVFALLMVAVLVNITLIQVVNAGDYRDRPGNQRILLASTTASAGRFSSVPTRSRDRWRRVTR